MQEHLENKRGIHLQAVVTACDPDASSFSKWVMSLKSIFLVIIQLSVILWLNVEASHPTCAEHSDCNIGEYCAPYKAFPRCEDCPTVNFSTFESCKVYENVVDSYLIWTSSGYDHYPLLNQTAIDCVRTLHCVQSSIIEYNVSTDISLYPDGTDSFEDSYFHGCDYLSLIHSKVTFAHIMVLIFVSMVFAVYLWEDIYESMTEEAILDYGLMQRYERPNRERGEEENPLQENNRATSNEQLPDTPGISSPAEIIRLSLRIRRFVLPWGVAAAGALITIRDTISSKNLLLNVLAIVFLTEADNQLGKIFATPNTRDMINEYLENLTDSTVELRVSSLVLFESRTLEQWSRFLSIAPIILMILSVPFATQLVHFIAPVYSDDALCANISFFISRFYYFYFPILCVGIEATYRMVTKDKSEANDSFVAIMLDLSRNINGVFFSILLWWITDIFMFNVYEAYIFTVIYFYCLLMSLCYSRYMNAVQDRTLEQMDQDLVHETQNGSIVNNISYLYICFLTGLVSFEIAIRRLESYYVLMEGYENNSGLNKWFLEGYN